MEARAAVLLFTIANGELTDFEIGATEMEEVGTRTTGAAIGEDAAAAALLPAKEEETAVETGSALTGGEEASSFFSCCEVV